MAVVQPSEPRAGRRFGRWLGRAARGVLATVAIIVGCGAILATVVLVSVVNGLLPASVALLMLVLAGGGVGTFLLMWAGFRALGVARAPRVAGGLALAFTGLLLVGAMLGRVASTDAAPPANPGIGLIDLVVEFLSGLWQLVRGMLS